MNDEGIRAQALKEDMEHFMAAVMRARSAVRASTQQLAKEIMSRQNLKTLEQARVAVQEWIETAICLAENEYYWRANDLRAKRR